MMTGIEQWQPVHLAYLSAVDAGLGWQFGNAVFARRFDFDGRGRLDVMEKDVIEKICQDLTLVIPLSWTEIHRKKLDKICASGIRRSELDGVFGVPFFVLEDDGVEEYFWGNGRIDWLLEAAGITSDPAVKLI